MEFFVPAVNNTEKQENNYSEVRALVAKKTGSNLSQRRIYKLWYTHNSKNLIAQVGECDQLTGEIIKAIFCRDDESLYYICTPTRGENDLPILAGGHNVFSSEDFEPVKI